MPRRAPTTSPFTPRPPRTRSGWPATSGRGRQGRDQRQAGHPLEPYLEILPQFDTLLIMSVEPGFGGQSFIPEVLSKVRIVRKMVDAGS